MIEDIGNGFFVARDDTSRTEYRLLYRGPEPTTEEEAWAITIEKWRNLKRHPFVSDGAGTTCGLCLLYFIRMGGDCTGCPVCKAGYCGCSGTPYRDWQEFPSSENAANVLDFALAIKRRISIAEGWRDK